MKINKIILNNFRNWENRSFDFSERVLIYGPNAQGKTNILEALYLMATTRSFRGKDTEIIKDGTGFLRLTGEIQNEKLFETEVIIKKTGSKAEKEFRINDKKRPSIDFVGEFSAIVFSPEDINVISGPPDGKRRYLSFTLGQKDREYLFDLLNYKKVLRQRNELLKKCDLGTIKQEIDIWDENLSEYGQKIIDKRKKLADFINTKFSDYYQNLSGETHLLSFSYEPELWGDDLKTSLLNARERDTWEKTTTVGPHRDSWRIFMDGLDVASYSSRGELRTVVLALKLCERDYFLTRDTNPPVILLDDVFSELDENRRRYLVNAFSGSQLIMTTTDLDHLEDELKIGTQLININQITSNKEQISNKTENLIVE